MGSPPVLAPDKRQKGNAMRLGRILALALFALMLASCLPTGPLIQTKGVHGAANYALQLWQTTLCPQQNQTVTLRAKVTNDSALPEIADAKDQPVFDIIVVTPSKTIRWSDGKPMTPEFTRLALQPGEFKSIQLQFAYQFGGNTTASARFVYDGQSPEDVIVLNTSFVSDCYY